MSTDILWYHKSWVLHNSTAVDRPLGSWLFMSQGNRSGSHTALPDTLQHISGTSERYFDIQQCHVVVLCIAIAADAHFAPRSVCAALQLSQLLTRLPVPVPRLLILTSGAQLTSTPASVATGGVWGLARVQRLEQPTQSVLCGDVTPELGAAQAAGTALFAAAASRVDPELAWGKQAWQTLRLRRGRAAASATAASVLSLIHI